VGAIFRVRWSGDVSGARPWHVRVRVVSRFSALQKTCKNIEMAANASVFQFCVGVVRPCGCCPAPARFLPGSFLPSGRFLPGSCPVPARFLPGSCPAAGSCLVPARFLPRSARFVRLGRRPASHPRPISKVADLGSRLGLSIQARGPDGLVVGFRRFGIGRWKARHSTFPTGCLRAKTDEVSSSTFRALIEPNPCVRRLAQPSSLLRRGPQLQPSMAHAV